MTSIQCAYCGRFLGLSDFEAGHCEYTPETEFGHERIEWTCRRCDSDGTRSAETEGLRCLSTSKRGPKASPETHISISNPTETGE